MTTQDQGMSFEAFVPVHEQVDLGNLWGLIDEEVERFIARTPKSAALFQDARESMVNGLPNAMWTQWRLEDPRTQDFLLPHFWYWAKGKNQKAWDADGNEYIDYMYADTPTIWGHGPDDAFTRGLADFVRNESLCSMIPNDESVVVTQLLQKLIDMKYWYITLSASDSNRNAINIARNITGRRKVLSPQLGYMGGAEEGMYWQPDPNSPPVPRWGYFVASSEDPAVKICEFNNLESVEHALKDRDVAIFITEPLMTDGGFVVAQPGYLEGVQALCKKYGTLLLIDETHTLTHAPRGMYTDLGLKADMWVSGKAIAGGVACGVLGLSQEVGDAYQANIADLSVPFGIACFVGQGTTCSANPLSVRALRLALEHYYTDETYDKMTSSMDHLCEGMQAVFDRRNAPFSLTRNGARVHINFMPEVSHDIMHAVQSVGLGGYHEYLVLFALNRGFIIMPWENMLLTSPYNTREDNDAFVAMFDECIGNMLGG